MTELNPLAVQNAALLRELIKEGSDRPASVAELARRLERDESNVRKTVKALGGEGLLFANTLRLSGNGIEQVEAIDRAEGRASPACDALSPGAAVAQATALADGMLALRHDQILPDSDNARQDWDSEEAQAELAALHDDIVKNGLLQNLVVRRMAADDLQANTITVTDAAGVEQTLPRYRLVAGERRWRAIDIAIGDGDWSLDAPILARLLDTDPKELRFAAIAENLLRRKLNPIEKATGFEQLAEVGFANKDMAERLGFTPEHVQQHRRFLKLDVADQQRMTLPRDDPKHLSVRDARAKLTAMSDLAARAITLGPLTRLAWIELEHAAYTRGAHPNWWNEVVVAAGASETPEAQRLAEINGITFSGLLTHGLNIGRFTARRDYQANGIVLAHPLPDPSEVARNPERLRAEQIDALGEGAPFWPSNEPVYATPWIAEPGEPTEEGVALIEAARLAAETREQAARDHADAMADRNKVWAQARQRHMQLLAIAHQRPEAGQPEEVISIASDLDRPLPWVAYASGVIAAANGKTVKERPQYGLPSEQDLTINQMIVVAANAAGGVLTPTSPTPDETQAEDDQDEAAEPSASEAEDDDQDEAA